MADVLNAAADSALSSAAPVQQQRGVLFGGMIAPAGATEVTHTVTARQFVSAGDPGEYVFAFESATRPLGFNLNSCVTTEDSAVVINAFKEDVAYLFTDPVLKPEFRRTTFTELLSAEGPPRDSWTVHSWVLVGATQNLLRHELTELRDLVSRIRSLLPLSRSAQTIHLAGTVLARQAARGRPDIEAWADRLARDVADAND